jgi:XTP/dITP diphosphohydrolase
LAAVGDMVFSKLVIASNNKGKVKEIGELLKPYNIEVLSAGDFPYPEPVETGTTFTQNAEIKSRYYALKTGLPALSDDSGLEVPALEGRPGVYSADWSATEQGRDFYLAMDKVEKELNKKNIKTRGQLTEEQRAKLECNFTCLLSLCYPDGKTLNFEGKVHGHLTFPIRGEAGFGYDPLFTPKGYDKTFAEMNPDDKYKISHRADAFNKLKKCLSHTGA